MEAKRCRNGHSKSTQMTVDRWLDLPTGPLGQIFNNLNPIDMLLVVPLVCKDWGRILCEILFFNNKDNLLDFRPLRFAPFRNIFYESGNKNSRAMKLMNLLVGVILAFASNGARDAPILKIIFPSGLPFYDRHLVYIAERCPELKSIHLYCTDNITGRGLTRALRFWTGIEELTYGPFSERPLYTLRFSRTIEEIGKYCKNLRFLELNCFELHWQSADIIVRNLKSVKSLCLCGVGIHKYGLQIFLSRCKIVGVNFSCCILEKSEDRGNFIENMNITRIQEGRRIRWRTDRFPHDIDKLHTSKELVDLLWK